MVLLFILILPGGSFSEEVMVIKAEGTHENSGATGEVKRKALDDALKKAVIKAMGTFMKEESIKSYSSIFENTIFANTQDYILNYRVTAEGFIKHSGAPSPERELEPGARMLEMYHIWIEASIDARKLKRDVRQMTTIGEEEVSTVTIVVLGVRDYRSFDSIKSTIEGMQMLKDLSYGSFYKGRTVLIARIAGTSQLFWEGLSEVFGEAFIVIPGDNNKIIIKATGKKPGRE